MVKAFKLKIEPEFTSSARRFLDDIKKSFNITGGPAGGAPRRGGGGGAGLLAPGGLVVKALLVLIAGFEVIKPVLSILKGILRVIGEFLRPISDIMVLLLMPILQILKPILLVVRQIMQPFRIIAFNLSREAGQAFREGDTARGSALTGLSVAAITTGVGAVFAFFTKETIKNFFKAAGELTKAILKFLVNMFSGLLQFFGVNTEILKANIEGFIDGTISTINDVIDVSIATLVATNITLIKNSAAKLGVNIQDSFLGAIGLLDSLFVGEDNSFRSVWENLITVMNNGVKPRFQTAMNGLVTVLDEAATSIENIALRTGASTGADPGRFREIFREGGGTTGQSALDAASAFDFAIAGGLVSPERTNLNVFI